MSLQMICQLSTYNLEMNDLSKYLLYTEDERASFLSRWGDAAESAIIKYCEWIRKLPYDIWFPFIRSGASAAEAAFVVGILCLIYERREYLNCFFSFNQGATAIRRDSFEILELQTSS